MACPFSRRMEGAGLPRQGSISEAHHWNIEEDIDIPDDALALTHLQLAIQLLTAPSVCVLCITQMPRVYTNAIPER